MGDDGEDPGDAAFTEAADLLMSAIDAFRTAGLSDDDIMCELKARLET